MGKKDDYQFDYLDDDRRFADQINGALLCGRQIIKPEELEPDESQMVSTGEKNGTGDLKTIVDKARIWKGKKLHILAVENQNYVDYQMVLRNMLEVVANIKIPEECRVMEEGEERYDMCKAFEDMRQEGYDEGIEKGICALIQICMELGISNDVIIEKCAENYEITKERAREYVEGKRTFL